MPQFRKVLVFAMLISLPTLGYSECKKVLRWNDDAPFSYMDKRSSQIMGISVDTTRTALARLGCQMELIELPWARALVELEAGRIDIIDGAYRTPERLKYANFSNFAFYYPNILFINAESTDRWQLQRLSDITQSNFKLGVQINVNYGEGFSTLLQNEQVAQNLVTHSVRKSLWKMLALNRIDGVISDELTGLIEQKELGLGQKIISTPISLSGKPSFFAFSQRTTSAAFVAAFDIELSKLAADGTIQRIKKTYIERLGTDSPP